MNANECLVMAMYMVEAGDDKLGFTIDEWMWTIHALVQSARSQIFFGDMQPFSDETIRVLATIEANNNRLDKLDEQREMADEDPE